MAQLINSLLNEIGNRLGLPDLSLDDNNQLFLDLEGQLAMSMHWREETETLLLNASVCKKKCSEPTLLEVILKTNCVFADESSLAFNMSPNTGFLNLSQVISITNHSSFALEATLDRFIKTASAWHSRFEHGTEIVLDWQNPQNITANDQSTFAPLDSFV